MKTNIAYLIPTVIRAGKAILEVYNSEDFQIEIKDDNSPLTIADKASNDIITESLEKLTPDIPILSEEGKEVAYEARQNWSKFWCVDPLDGTKEFIKRNGEFTVNIALVENGKPIAGIIYAPLVEQKIEDGNEKFEGKTKNSGIATKKTEKKLNVFFRELDLDSIQGTIYIGDKDNGAYRISARGIESIQVSSKAPQEELSVVQSRSHSGEEENEFYSSYKIAERLSKGSSLKICIVAEGDAELYFRGGPTWEWDTAAGHAILNSAGGYFVNKDLSEVVYNKEIIKNFGFIASSFRVNN